MSADFLRQSPSPSGSYSSLQSGVKSAELELRVPYIMVTGSPAHHIYRHYYGNDMCMCAGVCEGGMWGGGATSVAQSEHVDKMQPAELSKWEAMLSFVSIKWTLPCV